MRSCYRLGAGGGDGGATLRVTIGPPGSRLLLMTVPLFDFDGALGVVGRAGGGVFFWLLMISSLEGYLREGAGGGGGGIVLRVTSE